MANIPEEYLCPINLEIMNDPVICNDGYTYERSAILRISNCISPITRQKIDLHNLIPNRNLKNSIERYKVTENKQTVNMSKLEMFEYEQKIKRQEMLDRLKREKIEKDKRDKEELERKKIERHIEMEENLQLNRIINMFNTQSNGVFNYGGIKIYINGMNQWENTSYELISKGQQKYQFTTDMIKYIKNISRTTLTEKYDKLMSDYLFVNKYVIGEDSNPFIEFVFDEFVENNSYLEGELNHIEEIQKQINHLLEFRNRGTGWGGTVYDNLDSLENNKKELLKKIDMINEIKNKIHKTKEYYIVNYEDFCKDFNVKEINYNVLNKDWNILQHWVKTKQKIFNVLIQNIFDIYNKELDKNNFVKIDNIKISSCSHYTTSPEIHLLDGYKNYVELSTQCSCTSKERGIGIDHLDLQTDYTLTYFVPLIDLTKNIIKLIDFIQEN
jgi:hypothetical protein